MNSRLLLFLVLAIVAMLTLAGVYSGQQLQQKWFVQEQEVWVVRGDNYNKVLRKLKDEPLSWPQKLWIKYKAHNLQTGLFRLTPTMGFNEVVLRLSHPSDLLQVTIVEGDNMYQVADKLEASGIVTREAFLAACQNPAWLEKHQLGFVDRCEGFLYPETYSFAPFLSAENILNAFWDSFWLHAGPLLEKTGNGKNNIKAAYRILRLASIVEKETGNAEERPLIASVFLNRIIRGMPLQSDPTTIYGIWERFDGNLRRKDLREATPYNTYSIRGITPTPIANPGKAAIHAVLYPRASSYLYFVAMGSEGRHYFSHSYKEHQQAVRRYQLGLK